LDQPFGVKKDVLFKRTMVSTMAIHLRNENGWFELVFLLSSAFDTILCMLKPLRGLGRLRRF
jgi:hypothetical protein